MLLVCAAHIFYVMRDLSIVGSDKLSVMTFFRKHILAVSSYAQLFNVVSDLQIKGEINL